MQVALNIILFRTPYTVCYITDEYLVLPNKQYYESIGVNVDGNCDVQKIEENSVNKCKLRYTSAAIFLQPFLRCLKSDVYRTNVIINLHKRTGSANGTVLLKLILEPPDLEIIDYAWNDRLSRIIWTRVEIENAFSWLSTLGGAYSALGDYFESCAEEAGRISVRQFKLSKMLGDDGLAERSRLYSALALAQKGYLRTARHICRKVNNFALETKDKRLNRMCQGVWTKLRYMRIIRCNKTIQGNCKGDGNNKKSIIK